MQSDRSIPVALDFDAEHASFSGSSSSTSQSVASLVMNWAYIEPASCVDSVADSAARALCDCPKKASSCSPRSRPGSISSSSDEKFSCEEETSREETSAVCAPSGALQVFA